MFKQINKYMLKFVDKVKLILESNSSWHDSAAHSGTAVFSSRIDL